MENVRDVRARVDVRHPFLVMMGLYIGAFVGMFSESSLNIALPALIEEFGVNTAIAQWLVIGYMLVIGLVLPFAGILMKWFEVRKIILFALSAFFVGSLLSGLAPNFASLLAGRFVQGIGTGLILPIMFSVMFEIFPSNKIGAASGLASMIIMFAPAIGPTLSGFIVAALSWRWLFFLFAIVLFIAIVFAAKFLVSPYKLTRPHVDILSCVTSCVGFGCIVLGAGMASLYGWISIQVLTALIFGIIALIVFSNRQLSMKHPVLNLRSFKTREFAIGSILVMLNFGITLSAMYLFPQYLQNGFGYAVAVTGMIMLPGGIINAIVSLLAGRLFDKIGASLLTKCGFAISIVGAVLLITSTKDSSIARIIMCHVLMMIGVPLAMSPAQTYGLNSLSSRQTQDGSTILNTMQQVLGAICTAVATSLLSIGQSHTMAIAGTTTQEAFTNGAHLGFTFTLALAIIGFIVSLGVRSYRRSSVRLSEAIRN